MQMKVSLDGLLSRMKGDKGQEWQVEQFLKHYWLAKKAMGERKYDLVAEFFELYVIEQEEFKGKSQAG